MSATAYLNGMPLTLDPARSLGKGGEADVYDLGNGSAAKVWKTPDHPDFEGSPDDQRAAELRIASHQTKMRAFPKELPEDLVAPTGLLTDRTGQAIVGYVMPAVRDAVPLHAYADPVFRRSGVSGPQVVALFDRLATALRRLHSAGVVLGDFNDFNVLVTPDGTPKIIDADSAQFGKFLCTVFTERFVDPTLCAPDAPSPQLVRPYTASADWYAFYALLFQSIFYLSPFGGIFKPNDPARRVPHATRPMRRISVFHPEVVVPKQTPPFDILGEEWLHQFRSVFEGGERTEVSSAMLRRMTFLSCGARASKAQNPENAKQVRGHVTSETLFKTAGIVLLAVFDESLRVVIHEDGAYHREDGTLVCRGALDPAIHFHALGAETIVARGRELVRMSGTRTARYSVDAVRGIPSFACNGRDLFWSDAGRLRKAEPSPLNPDGQRHIGDVLEGQTRFWVGPTFGIGFYRAGQITRAFVFDASRGTVRDDVRLPRINGEIVDATATIDREHAWLFLAINEGARVRHRCLVYTRDGACVASAEAERGDGTWLGSFGGALATGGVLLVPTDAGLVRISRDGGALRVTRDFPDTEPFVDASCRLLAGSAGSARLVVVHANKILSLHMKSA